MYEEYCPRGQVIEIQKEENEVEVVVEDRKILRLNIVIWVHGLDVLKKKWERGHSRAARQIKCTLSFNVIALIEIERNNTAERKRMEAEERRNVNVAGKSIKLL